jgi:putative spermidine/putrescine transport system permease protein
MSSETDLLKVRLRRAERMRQVKAFGLIAPLLGFLLLTFVVPIASMMVRSVHDTELASVWPEATAAIKSWHDRKALPDEATFAALAHDLKSSQKERTLSTAARRLNYDLRNGRSLVFSTARALPETAERWTDAVVAANPRWADVETWGAVARASGPVTGFFLLAALDRHRTAAGKIVHAPVEEAIFVDVLERTFVVSLTVTLLCLALGYPVAYLLANLPPDRGNLLMILVLLPFWTSLLVRTAAWVVVLQENGIVNNVLIWLGILEKPVRLIYNQIGVYVAMTHILLPFMILPLYSVMKAIPPSYVRAARSLGASPATAFLRVYVPQTLPGIGAGGILVFIMAIGYYITPALVGGAGDQMISYFIAYYTSSSVNWGLASALGAVLLSATLILYWIYNRLVGADGVKLG